MDCHASIKDGYVVVVNYHNGSSIDNIDRASKIYQITGDGSVNAVQSFVEPFQNRMYLR